MSRVLTPGPCVWGCSSSPAWFLGGTEQKTDSPAQWPLSPVATPSLTLVVLPALLVKQPFASSFPEQAWADVPNF